MYFKELFKYAYENEEFDYRCYEDYIPYDDIAQIGFSGLVSNDASNVNYDGNLIVDSKAHYFGNYKKPIATNSSNKNRISSNGNIERYIYAYNDDGDYDHDLRENYATRYGLDKKDLSGVSGYNLSTEEYMIDGFSGYTKASVNKLKDIDTATPIDASTNQIVNNKRLKMKVYLRNKNWASNYENNDGLCEVKYLDEIVIPYITQMIPSSTIFEVQYVERYEYVDLGLPSGTLWATCNVGASKPSDAGLYFQWGDTSGYTADQVGGINDKKYFSWSDYKWSIEGSSSNFSKYTNSGATLDLEDDAAHVNMDGDWHMPSPKQIKELVDNTTTAWTTSDGISGITFTSNKNKSKSIFIPAAGIAANGFVDGSGTVGYVWCSMLEKNSSSHGLGLYLGSGGSSLATVGIRSCGFSVRGVLLPNQDL